MPEFQTDLGNQLAQAIPRNVKVTVRHISTTPTPCDALFAAPQGEYPETTFCENHFLAVSIDVGEDGDKKGADKEVLVFGIEALVYSTVHLTTVFVSKADSTGYLHLLKDGEPTNKKSLLKRISTTFLAYLVDTRQRPGVRLVLSLFARAQNQYLFPGSIMNTGKHVLDDRGLIKWWCRVVDPILRERESEMSEGRTLAQEGQEDGKGCGHVDTITTGTESVNISSATTFLIVPGCDKFETRGFFPPTVKLDNVDARPRWVNGYPVRQICTNPDAPLRCLIPRPPDDPKTRFVNDLDNEVPESQTHAAGQGQWKSVKTLDQFWDMMSFRQECSAGRLVGFLWLVINPPRLGNSTSKQISTGQEKGKQQGQEQEQHGTSLGNPSSSSPLPKQSCSSSPPTNPFFWPEAGRGHVILGESDYKSAMDFILEQDFENFDIAATSTKVWVDKVASLADELYWGEPIIGRNTESITAGNAAATQPVESKTKGSNVLGGGIVRKRKKPAPEEVGGEADNAATETEADVGAKAGDVASGVQDQEPAVNVLNGSFVRRKRKA